MSEKKSKEQRRTIELPVYKPERQLSYIKALCASQHFDADHLVSLILQEFIYTIELAAYEQDDFSAPFFAYLEHSVKVADKFKDFIKKVEVENGKEKDRKNSDD